MKNYLNFLFCFFLIAFNMFDVSSQTWQWVKNISGNDTITERAVACDQSNDIYVIGTFSGTAYFDATNSLTANTGCKDYFIVKYDQNGNFIWVMQGATSVPSTKNNFGRNVVFDGSGNLYIAGFNAQTATFNNGISVVPNIAGTSSGFILKISSSGTALASVVYAYGSAITSESMAISQSGDLTISGNYTGSLTLYGSGSSYPAATSKNHFIVQYTTSFSFNWANVFTGSTTTTKLLSICTCTNQGFYVGGFLRGALTIDLTTLYSKAGVGEDIVLIKIDNSGNVLWIRQAGSLNADRCNEISSDNSGNAYLAGYINSSAINFDSTGTGIFDSRGFPSQGGYDCVVAKYNSQGTFQWATVLGDANYQVGYGLATNDSNVAVTGTFAGNLSCNNTLTTGMYNKDIFVGVIDKDGLPLYASKAGGATNVEDRGERICFDSNKNILLSGFYYSNPLKFGADSIIPGVTPNVFLVKCETFNLTSLITNVSTYGGNDGSINITVNGGISPFSFLWNNAATTQNLSNITAGTYSVTVTDANSARAISSFLITQPSGLFAGDSAKSSPTIICPGTASTLEVFGGALTTGSNWYWYTGSCGGTAAGTGLTRVQYPLVTTTYFVRAERGTTVTTCVSATVTTKINSIPADSADSSPSMICLGNTTTISLSGGSLGTGALWKWWSGSCGGITRGTGAALAISPTVSTTYYVRAQGTCNTTTCVSTLVIVNSTQATSASASPASVISGSPSTLHETGGVLGLNSQWFWYTLNCGGTFSGTGASPVVYPTTTTTYFVRVEGTCNTTNCVSTTITVCTTSNPASSASCSPSLICSGSASTLSLTGGLLGVGAVWKWFSGSCGGITRGTGTTLILSPTVTTIYFVRAQGVCNTTVCVSASVVVNSTAATSASASPATIPPGSSTTLTETGGILGLNSQWYWYSESCGGTALGTGTSIAIFPTVSLIYYVRVEGPCNTTNCVSVSVTVCSNSTSATSASSSPAMICSGSTTTLSLTGGDLGIGAVWKWYSGSCGGITRGTGTTLILSPTATTIYFVRAQGVCNTTTCMSTSVIVNSTAATSVSASPASITSGLSSTLTQTGGILGLNSQWFWYSDICGGTLFATGSPIVVFPTVSSIYYIRAEGTCNTTTCLSVGVTVCSISTAATSATASPSLICSGSSSSLSFTGGTLGVGAVWKWYSGSCGGITRGSGDTLVIAPTVTTIYFVRAQGACNTTACVSVTLTILTNSTAATSINASPTGICSGNSGTLTQTGGSLGVGAGWYWYSAACGGIFIGSTSSITVSPTVETIYYLRAEGTCNTTACTSVTITINTPSIPASAATVNPSIICEGLTATLSLTGGSLGPGAKWYWYSGSCGGTFSGTGLTIIESPVSDITYYVRAQSSCDTTTCSSVTLTVCLNSTPASSAIASPSSVCSGNSSTLSLSGGSLCSSEMWKWWSLSCGGYSVGTGTSVVVDPTITTTYYVRAQGLCTTSACVSTIIIVNSTAPTSASASPVTINSGSPSTLTKTGGVLGINSQWYWYSESCDGTFSGTGISLVVSPTISTLYFVRVEGPCNTTSCASTTVSVCTLSSSAGSAFASPSLICSGSATTLSLTGGILGVGAVWKWYSVSCGGITRGTGDTLIITPTVTTTYYVRAQGLCNTTTCVSTIVIVNSTEAASATASPSSVVSGSSSTLTLTGGILGLNSIWYWYSGSCGGTFTGTGTTIIQSPTYDVSFFVRAEGTCNTTNCVSTAITVCSTSTPASSASGSPSSICSGSSSTLGLSGGSLGNAEAWKWYLVSCGSGIVGTGVNIVVSPSVTTKYYVRAQGNCSTTTCVSTTIIVNSSPASSASASPSEVSSGNSTTLAVIGGVLGPESAWNWYSGSCGGTFIGTGSTIIQSPTVDFIYYVRAEGTCNTTICVSTAVSICSNSSAPVSISATVTSICGGDSTILSPLGGSLGDGANWFWYKTSCGGTYLNSGIQIQKKPTGNITFWVRAENNCNTTTCASVFITYLGANRPASGISASPSSLTAGSSSTLTETGATYASGGKSHWYSGSCGVDQVGTGNSTIQSPTITTIYYVRSENSTCNFSVCVSVTVTVTAAKILWANNISGNKGDIIQNELVVYPNPANDNIYVKYNIAAEGIVKISFFNILGEEVKEIINNSLVKGTYNTCVNLSEISAGIYTCKMIINREVIKNTKFVISK